MKIIFRIIALIFVVPATYYFIFWAPCSLLPLGEQRWIANILSLTCAVAAGWFVWIKTKSINDGAISTMVFGAVLLGGIGFTGGFFGPIIFTPSANQGPLLEKTRDTPHIYVANVKIGRYYLTHAKNSPHHSTRLPTPHHATRQQPRYGILR